MRKELSIFALGGILGIFTLNYVLNRNNITEEAINKLKIKNDSLLKDNAKLDSINSIFLKELNNANYEILELKNKDNALETRINYYNKEITIIKTKYEKAKTFADSYGSDDIKRYFSNLR